MGREAAQRLVDRRLNSLRSHTKPGSRLIHSTEPASRHRWAGRRGCGHSLVDAAARIAHKTHLLQGPAPQGPHNVAGPWDRGSSGCLLH